MNQGNSRKRGRPKKQFHELSVITKRQNAKKLCEEISIEELGFTLEKNLKSAGHYGASKVIKNLIARPEIGNEYIKLKKNHQTVVKYTSDEALALSVDMKLSKRQYQLMYFGAKKRKMETYPSYDRILSAKKRCYPSHEVTCITEIGFKINLQALLDITAQRLVDTIQTPLTESTQKLCLISKYGFDGASSQSNYKQKFADPNADDSSIFISSLVPIVLHDVDQSENVYWRNLKPSSTTLCRPLRLQFQKETEEFVLQIDREIKEEIDELTTTVIIKENYTIEISHQLICTMIDGKICNHLSGNKSSQTCFICNATPKSMNKLDLVYKRPKNTEFYKYGLSTLHAWIRFMECVLHISYNLSFHKWSARKREHKNERKLRKEEIQRKFKKLGLRVDFVLQGKGTSNDGNTARRFFGDFETSAEITGFNVQLLKRFAVILQAMASGKEIDVERFRRYSKETARLYVELYPWYYMPATVHKILIHGSDVIDFAVVPIGQLSEEVLECRHKEIRRYREQNTRKVSRIKTNEDLLHALLISSDPVISSYRQIENSKKKEMFAETNSLLIDTDVANSEMLSEEE